MTAIDPCLILHSARRVESVLIRATHQSDRGTSEPEIKSPYGPHVGAAVTESESEVADDNSLVKLAATRGLPGQIAFERLVDRHQQWLVRLLVHLLASQTDAEDVAQEAFIRAFLAIEDCKDGNRFRGWLRVIARRLAFNHRRDAKTRAHYEENSGVLASQNVAPISGRVEGRDLLKQVLGELSYPYREIMVLRFVEELPLKEIAAVLEVGESAAKMRLSRARAEFQRIFSKKGGTNGDSGQA